jgi:hypothetical protein
VKTPFRLLIVFVLLSVSSAKSADLTAAWPASWKQAYERFQKFLRLRGENWPASDLSVSKDGVFDAEVWNSPSKNNVHQSITTYQDGVIRLGGPPPDPNYLFAGKSFAAVTIVCSDMGYQHVFPLVWFEIVPTPGWELSLPGGEKRTIRPLPAPQPEASFWPNERLLSWLDFQILPGRHPDDIREANDKVNPAAFLQVDELGIVHRANVFAHEAERFLTWRVFCNGRLVYDAPTAGKPTLPLASYGAGFYIVLVGLNGPDGFFPISNLLKFSLAPRNGADGLRLLFFKKFDYRNPDDYPDWYRAILSPPLGKGPLRFSDKKQLQAAQKLADAWQGSLEGFNAPDAAWIYHAPAPSNRK